MCIRDRVYWLLVAGCWLLVTGYWLLVAGCWLLVAGCWLLVARFAMRYHGSPRHAGSDVCCPMSDVRRRANSRTRFATPRLSVGGRPPSQINPLRPEPA